MAAKTDRLPGFGHTQSALMRLLLRNKPGLTVDQIAQGLGVSRTAVNQHLTALERDGHVMRADPVATGGRPGRAYRLSERGMHLFPKNYDLFSLKTLQALIDALGGAKANRLLDQLGRDLGRDLGETLKGQKLSAKTPAIAAALKDLGFDAHVEKNAPGAAPAVTAYNCVYHALAQANPDVCRLDLAFLREAADADVDHIACMAKGDNACRFQFRRRRSRTEIKSA